MPRLAEDRGHVLRGLADAVDAGWPIGRALVMSHQISVDPFERRSLESAMRWIQRGAETPVALEQTSWLDEEDVAWLSGAKPERTASLLRSIADQNIRDARANVRWAMAVLFPIVVLMLGFWVLMFSTGLFSALSGLVHKLASFDG